MKLTKPGTRLEGGKEKVLYYGLGPWISIEVFSWKKKLGSYSKTEGLEGEWGGKGNKFI